MTKKEILLKLYERYKSFCISKNHQFLKWFSINDFFTNSFMQIDFSDLSIRLFDFEKSSGYFSSDDKRYYYPYTYEEIVKIVDGNLKKYYDFKKEILKDKIDNL
jgi:hypothetical protein